MYTRYTSEEGIYKFDTIIYNSLSNFQCHFRSEMKRKKTKFEGMKNVKCDFEEKMRSACNLALSDLMVVLL